MKYREQGRSKLYDSFASPIARRVTLASARHQHAAAPWIDHPAKTGTQHCRQHTTNACPGMFGNYRCRWPAQAAREKSRTEHVWAHNEASARNSFTSTPGRTVVGLIDWPSSNCPQYRFPRAVPVNPPKHLRRQLFPRLGAGPMYIRTGFAAPNKHTLGAPANISDNHSLADTMDALLAGRS